MIPKIPLSSEEVKGWLKSSEKITQEFNEFLAQKDKPESVFSEAEKLIYGDREQTHGNPSKNLSRIAEFWTAYLQKNLRLALIIYNAGPYAEIAKYSLTEANVREITENLNINIDVTDVCRMMEALKWARDENMPRRDNVVDVMGYEGLVYRCREKSITHLEPNKDAPFMPDFNSVKLAQSQKSSMKRRAKPKKHSKTMKAKRR